MSTIKIDGIMYGTHKIGIALSKMNFGDNYFEITVKNKLNEILYPGVFKIDFHEAVQKYGKSIINRKNLVGIWVPLMDLYLYKVPQPSDLITS